MKSFTQFLLESNQTITLYHGGRGLENTYRDTISHQKNSWYEGPGLYLTTNYSTAYKYAKGGGKLYAVTVEEGTDINDVKIPIENIKEFVERSVIKSKQKSLLERIQEYVKDGKINAEIFLNSIMNNEAIQNTKTGILKDFLVQQGADYAIIRNFQGSVKQTVLVVMNAQKIKHVRIIPVKETNQPGFVFDIPFEWK